VVWPRAWDWGCGVVDCIGVWVPGILCSGLYVRFDGAMSLGSGGGGAFLMRWR
jgi:hypothetical protein